MSNATRNYTIRLSASGKQQLEADLRALGASGEKSLRRIQTATKPANTGLRETDRAARELSIIVVKMVYLVCRSGWEMVLLK